MSTYIVSPGGSFQYNTTGADFVNTLQYQEGQRQFRRLFSTAPVDTVGRVLIDYVINGHTVNSNLVYLKDVVDAYKNLVFNIKNITVVSKCQILIGGLEFVGFELHPLFYAFRFAVKERDSLRVSIPQLPNFPDGVLWLRHQPATIENYQAICNALIKYATNLNGTYPAVAAGGFEAVLRGEDRINFFTNKPIFEFGNPALNTIICTALFTDVEWQGNEASLTNIAGVNLSGFSVGYTPQEPKRWLISILKRTLQTLNLRDDPRMLLYRLLIQLNERFGVPAQREYTVLGQSDSYSTGFTLDNIRSSFTLVGLQRGVLQNLGQSYPDYGPFFTSNEYLTLRCVAQVVSIRDAKVISSPFRYRENAEVPEPSSSAFQLDPLEFPSGTPIRTYKIADDQIDSTAGNVEYNYVVSDIKKHSESIGSYGYLMDDAGVESLPFQVADPAQTLVVRQAVAMTEVKDLLPGYFTPLLGNFQVDIRPEIKVVSNTLGDSLTVDFSDSFPTGTAGGELAWFHHGEGGSTQVQKGGTRFTIPKTSEDNTGDYRLEFTNAPVSQTMVAHVDFRLTCKRCLRNYNSSKNGHGACRFHSRHPEEIELAYDQANFNLRTFIVEKSELVVEKLNKWLQRNYAPIASNPTAESVAQSLSNPSLFFKTLPVNWILSALVETPEFTSDCYSLLANLNNLLNWLVTKGYKTAAGLNGLDVWNSEGQTNLAKFVSLMTISHLDQIAGANAVERKWLQNLLISYKSDHGLALTRFDSTDEAQLNRVAAANRPVNPNIFYGQMTNGKWACCARSLSNEGCYVGRHSSVTATPDISDLKHTTKPRRGTQWEPDLATDDRSYQTIRDAYNDGRQLDGIKAEVEFNRVHGGMLQPGFVFVSEKGLKLLTKILDDPEQGYRFNDMFELLDEVKFEPGFGFWRQSRELQLLYEAPRPGDRILPTPGTTMRLRRTVEIYTLFSALRLFNTGTAIVNRSTRITNLDQWLRRGTLIVPGPIVANPDQTKALARFQTKLNELRVFIGTLEKSLKNSAKAAQEIETTKLNVVNSALNTVDKDTIIGISQNYAADFKAIEAALGQGTKLDKSMVDQQVEWSKKGMRNPDDAVTKRLKRLQVERIIRILLANAVAADSLAQRLRDENAQMIAAFATASQGNPALFTDFNTAIADLQAQVKPLMESRQASVAKYATLFTKPEILTDMSLSEDVLVKGLATAYKKGGFKFVVSNEDLLYFVAESQLVSDVFEKFKADTEAGITPAIESVTAIVEYLKTTSDNIAKQFTDFILSERYVKDITRAFDRVYSSNSELFLSILRLKLNTDAVQSTSLERLNDIWTDRQNKYVMQNARRVFDLVTPQTGVTKNELYYGDPANRLFKDLTAPQIISSLLETKRTPADLTNIAPDFIITIPANSPNFSLLDAYTYVQKRRFLELQQELNEDIALILANLKLDSRQSFNKTAEAALLVLEVERNAFLKKVDLKGDFIARARAFYSTVDTPNEAATFWNIVGFAANEDEANFTGLLSSFDETVDKDDLKTRLAVINPISLATEPKWAKVGEKLLAEIDQVVLDLETQGITGGLAKRLESIALPFSERRYIDMFREMLDVLQSESLSADDYILRWYTLKADDIREKRKTLINEFNSAKADELVKEIREDFREIDTVLSTNPKQTNASFLSILFSLLDSFYAVPGPSWQFMSGLQNSNENQAPLADLFSRLNSRYLGGNIINEVDPEFYFSLSVQAEAMRTGVTRMASIGPNFEAIVDRIGKGIAKISLSEILGAERDPSTRFDPLRQLVMAVVLERAHGQTPGYKEWTDLDGPVANILVKTIEKIEAALDRIPANDPYLGQIRSVVSGSEYATKVELLNSTVYGNPFSLRPLLLESKDYTSVLDWDNMLSYPLIRFPELFVNVNLVNDDRVFNALASLIDTVTNKKPQWFTDAIQQPDPRFPIIYPSALTYFVLSYHTPLDPRDVKALNLYDLTYPFKKRIVKVKTTKSFTPHGYAYYLSTLFNTPHVAVEVSSTLEDFLGVAGTYEDLNPNRIESMSALKLTMNSSAGETGKRTRVPMTMSERGGQVIWSAVACAIDSSYGNQIADRDLVYDLYSEGFAKKSGKTIFDLLRAGQPKFLDATAHVILERSTSVRVMEAINQKKLDDLFSQLTVPALEAAKASLNTQREAIINQTLEDVITVEVSKLSKETADAIRGPRKTLVNLIRKIDWTNYSDSKKRIDYLVDNDYVQEKVFKKASVEVLRVFLNQVPSESNMVPQQIAFYSSLLNLLAKKAVDDGIASARASRTKLLKLYRDLSDLLTQNPPGKSTSSAPSTPVVLKTLENAGFPSVAIPKDVINEFLDPKSQLTADLLPFFTRATLRKVSNAIGSSVDNTDFAYMEQINAVESDGSIPLYQRIGLPNDEQISAVQRAVVMVYVATILTPLELPTFKENTTRLMHDASEKIASLLVNYAAKSGRAQPLDAMYYHVSFMHEASQHLTIEKAIAASDVAFSEPMIKLLAVICNETRLSELDESLSVLKTVVEDLTWTNKGVLRPSVSWLFTPQVIEILRYRDTFERFRRQLQTATSKTDFYAGVMHRKWSFEFPESTFIPALKFPTTITPPLRGSPMAYNLYKELITKAFAGVLIIPEGLPMQIEPNLPPVKVYYSLEGQTLYSDDEELGWKPPGYDNTKSVVPFANPGVAMLIDIKQLTPAANAAYTLTDELVKKKFSYHCSRWPTAEMDALRTDANFRTQASQVAAQTRNRIEQAKDNVAELSRERMFPKGNKDIALQLEYAFITGDYSGTAAVTDDVLKAFYEGFQKPVPDQWCFVLYEGVTMNLYNPAQDNIRLAILKGLKGLVDNVEDYLPDGNTTYTKKGGDEGAQERMRGMVELILRPRRAALFSRGVLPEIVSDYNKIIVGTDDLSDEVIRGLKSIELPENPGIPQDRAVVTARYYDKVRASQLQKSIQTKENPVIQDPLHLYIIADDQNTILGWALITSTVDDEIYGPTFTVDKKSQAANQMSEVLYSRSTVDNIGHAVLLASQLDALLIDGKYGMIVEPQKDLQVVKRADKTPALYYPNSGKDVEFFWNEGFKVGFPLKGTQIVSSLLHGHAAALWSSTNPAILSLMKDNEGLEFYKEVNRLLDLPVGDEAVLQNISPIYNDQVVRELKVEQTVLKYRSSAQKSLMIQLDLQNSLNRVEDLFPPQANVTYASFLDSFN